MRVRKYIFVSGLTALVTTIIIFTVAQTNTVFGRTLGSGGKSSRVSEELLNDPAFVAELQTKLGATQTAPQVVTKAEKGDKGDTGNRGVSGSDGSEGETGTAGIDGQQGTEGTRGLQGLPGETGATGATGARGAAGADGSPGAQGQTGPTGQTGAQGETGVVGTSSSSLIYDDTNKTVGVNSGYTIPLLSTVSNWDTAYGWGDHAQAGYALLSGKTGGQTLVGGNAANLILRLQANSASSGNTGSNAAIQFNVGNSGSTNAATITNNGNFGVGTSTPGSKFTLGGDMAITTTGADTLKPFQFMQITGLTDDPKITTFNSQNYSIADWNPAVVGFSSGGGCGTNWSNGSLLGFKYWWDNNNGNWRLNIDMSAPNDGCNSVQVMFVRKELSARANYGF